MTTPSPSSQGNARRQAVRSLLQRHKVADTAEGVHLDGMLSLIEAKGDPFSRRHFEPGHFTASAFVLSPDSASLLLILHRKLGRWLQPGGHIDPEDASVMAATRREVTEETGLHSIITLGDGLLDVDVHDIPPLADEPGHAHYDLRFLFQSEEWPLGDSAEVDGIRWVPRSEVPQMQTDESILRALRRIHPWPSSPSSR